MKLCEVGSGTLSFGRNYVFLKGIAVSTLNISCIEVKFMCVIRPTTLYGKNIVQNVRFSKEMIDYCREMGN